MRSHRITRRQRRSLLVGTLLATTLTSATHVANSRQNTAFNATPVPPLTADGPPGNWRMPIDTTRQDNEPEPGPAPSTQPSPGWNPGWDPGSEPSRPAEDPGFFWPGKVEPRTGEEPDSPDGYPNEDLPPDGRELPLTDPAPRTPHQIAATPAAPAAWTDDELVVTSSTPQLSATATDPGGKALKYTFQIAQHDAKNVIVASGKTTHMTPSGAPAKWIVPAGKLYNLGHYIFRVKASNKSNSSQWTEWKRLSVECELPQAG